MATKRNRAWVFQGEASSHASAIYTDFETAVKWILDARLSGVLTEYPVDEGVYDWAVSHDYYRRKGDDEPSFVGSFTSANQRHIHFEGGDPSDPIPSVAKGSLLTRRLWVFSTDRGRFPGGIFTSQEQALEWARSNKLTGILQPYPVNISLFEWMRRRLPKKGGLRRTADMIANYWAATPQDIRLIDGQPLPGSPAIWASETSSGLVGVPAVVISPSDIRLWADRTEARAQLPLLVARLIMASRARVRRLDFPAGESADLAGWDGVVVADGDDPFVPNGTSGWEVSVDRAVLRKLDRDYTKRSEDPGDIDPKTSTLVFVMARRSAGARAWARNRQAEGSWLAVRVYTADELAVWINSVPSVAMWFAALVGKIPTGVIALDAWWAEWSMVTAPPTAPALVLAGLTDVASTLQQWILAPPAPLVVRASTRDEAIAILASAATGGEVDQTHLARTWVADSPEAFGALVTSTTPLVLIANFEDRSRASAAVARGHHVFLPSDDEDPTTPSGIVATTRDRDAVESALVAMGIDRESAPQLAETARLSLSALRRRIAAVSILATPKWARSEVADALIGPLMLGSWDESRDADRRIVEEVCGQPYAAVEALLRRWRNEPDAPVSLIGSIWRFIDVADAWMLLHKAVGMLLLERFEEASLTVLGESDPRYDLPAADQYAAAVYGKTMRHSDRLRTGMASTITMIAATSESQALVTERSGQECANRVVSGLLSHANSRRWASLSGLLPLLAEAAPDTFLQHLDAALSDDQPVVASLFTDNSGAWTVSSPHTGLLWALEVLAWPSEYLSAVVDALARLAGIDPGGRLANRPSGSIAEILKLWHPSTCADSRLRLTVAERLAERYPNVAWTVISAGLPVLHGLARSTMQARWRNWRCNTGVSYAELGPLVSRSISLLLGLAGGDLDRWRNLVQLLDDLPHSERQLVLGELERVAGQLAEQDRAGLWNDLRELVERHRAFPTAGWALPGNALADMERVVELLAPRDIALASAWLFAEHPELPGFRAMPWDEQQTEARRRRREVVVQLFRGGGLDAVVRFMRTVEAPWTVGEAIVGTAPVEALLGLVQRELEGDDRISTIFARGILHELTRTQSPAIQQLLRQSQSPGVRAEVLSAMPFQPETWALVEKEPQEIRTRYWQMVSLYGRGSIESEHVEFVARKLVDHGFLERAIDFVHLYSDRVSLDVMALVLFAPFVEGTVRPLNFQAIATDIPSLLSAASDKGLDMPVLAQLEWNYLPLLREPVYNLKALPRRLREDPSFFVEVLQLVYKRRDDRRDETPSDDAKALAERAFSLLHNWKEPPGEANEHIEPEILNGWVDRARELAREAGRLEVADSHIGQVLAYLPTDSDETWPPRVLGELFERLRSSEVESGFLNGVFNKRGIVSKSLREGGRQEWELSERFAEWALAAAPRYPRLARVLRRLADGYAGEARREDAEAELGL